MTSDTTLLIIHLLEGVTDGVRNGTFKFSEREGRLLIDTMKGILYPQPKMRICNITQACDYLGLSQPTFRKYIREGKIPHGCKISGFTELIWNKDDIEKFKKERDKKTKPQRLFS